MKANVNTVLKTSSGTTVLVPYRKEHVEIYHAWMQDPFLQEMTASEPLSIDEEYAMQESWAVDEGKCTFIVLDSLEPTNRVGRSSTFGGMIGDVNLYLTAPTTAEIEIMIAEPHARGKKHGKTALLLMMHYAYRVLGITELFARVSDVNVSSLNLFRESLGFVVTEPSNYFKETTLAARSEQIAKALEQLADVEEGNFD
ncbi:N-acetyltransferase 9 [Geranomyces variabilis]|nr:N-acetyltransferase 9 [Geranomyces variabilis]